MAEQTHWTIGELAKQTGMTVRALHHYDAIGLLVPTGRSAAGHRRYETQDIVRLQHIISLKQLGFPLAEAKTLLDNPDFRPDVAIRWQLQRVTEHIRLQEDLRRRLEALYAAVTTRHEVTVDQLIQIIEVTMMIDKYFTPDQLAQIRQQADQLGPAKIKKGEEEWPTLIAQVRSAMAQGLPPESDEVQALARRWQALVALFTGGHRDIAAALERMYAENPDRATAFGIEDPVRQYIGQAMAHSRD